MTLFPKTFAGRLPCVLLSYNSLLVLPQSRASIQVRGPCLEKGRSDKLYSRLEWTSKDAQKSIAQGGDR